MTNQVCFQVALVSAAWTTLLVTANAQDVRNHNLSPIMAVPDQQVIDADFQVPMELPKSIWAPRQGTRWTVEDGVLRGRESSKDFQAARKDHFGYEPRLSLPTTPTNFICQVTFRFLDGQATEIVPFIEFGHHVCRVRFSNDGTTLISDGETMQLAKDSEFVLKSGVWYHALAEMKDGQFVIQFAGGPIFYAQRDSFAQPPTSGGNGFGIAGPKHGVVEIDQLAIWTVKPMLQHDWEKRKQQFPAIDPIQIKEPKRK